MKILAFTDVHADKRMLKKILKKAKHADFMLCSGDASIFGSGLEETIKLLKKADKQLLIIHGNHETEEDIINLSKKYRFLINIHKKSHKINDIIFIGYGGGGFALYDHELERYFKGFKRKYNKYKIVMVTHQPPKNTKLDLLPWFGHRGSISITKSIKLVKPLLFVCGHFHENFGKKDRIGKTLLINPSCDGRLIKI